ncbi:MAG: HlyD family efflux transporter periplasmic adaptor subunit [Pirellulales bacterium]
MTRCTLFSYTALAIAMLVGGPVLRPAAAADPVLYGCLVKLEEDIKLPSPEAGVLVQLSVKEGSQVRQGEVLGKIYDEEVQIQKKAAEYALGAAYKSATDDVQIRYAEKSAAVAEKNYEVMIESNQSVAKAVAEIEVRKAKLEWDASVLSAEKALHDQALAKFEYHQKKAERDAAQLAIGRRTILAPFDGEVVTIYRHQDEWVSPGDAILRLVRLDTMLVEGAIELSTYDPHEVNGCDVTVEVEMARGRKEQATGRITQVSSLVRLDGRYIVRAEVANRQEHGRWLLRDGMAATMTIRLNSAGAGEMDVSRTP